MIASIVKSITNLFGNKSQRDVKDLWPIVAEINQYFDSYASLSNDELRNKTIEFKSRIADYLSDIDQQINALKHEGDHLLSEDIAQKQEVYDRIDNLEKTKTNY